MFDPLVSVDGTGKNDVPVLAAVVPTPANGGVSKDGLHDHVSSAHQREVARRRCRSRVKT